MKNTLKLEGLAQFILGIYLFSLTSFAWWWFPLLLLTPDVGMVGYLVNSKLGAATYNLFHHKGIAILILWVGYFLDQHVLQTVPRA